MIIIIIIIMQYSDIINDLDDFQENINEGGIITNTFLKKFNYPDKIKELLKDDFTIVRDIVEYYYKYFTINMNKYDTFEDSFNNLSFIKYEKVNDKLKKYQNFNVIIFKWLKEVLFFENIYNNDNINIDTDEILEYKLNHQDINNNIEFRINQKDAFDRLEKNGLETGIHCQATGCGKTYIILKYIDYALKNIKNPKIILFTERVNILADLFEFDNNGKGKTNKENLDKWKQMGLCDLTNVNIINRVNNKEKNWVNMLNNSNKSTLLVINRAFLTIGSMYEKLNNLDLILHDECHNTSSEKCNNFLNFCKSKNFKIVGFSATPLRTGSDEVIKLLKIYGLNDKLNLLTDYNIIHAINNDLIVKPEFYWYQIEKYLSNSKDNEITKLEKESLKEILTKTMSNMISRKIIAWCGTIKLCKIWKLIFENEFNFKMDYYIDHSKINDLEYKKFRKSKGNCILFCANKHREGSDIPRLDACLFLDKIKSRGVIPFIQSIGRVLRKDKKLPEKNKGIIIDSLLKSEDYEQVVTNKIFEYYNALRNVSNITEIKKDKNFNYKKFIKIDKESNTVNVNIGNNIIKIICNKIKWDSLEKNIKTYLSKRFEYDVLSDLNNYDFYHSKIQKCILNNKLIDIKNYKPLITKTYEIINDVNKIKKFTTINIVNEFREDKGFYYLDNFKISIQGVDSKKSLKEIINQCVNNNIFLELDVKLHKSITIKIIINQNFPKGKIIKN